MLSSLSTSDTINKYKTNGSIGPSMPKGPENYTGLPDINASDGITGIVTSVDGKTIYIAYDMVTNGGLYVSTNHGTSWSRIHNIDGGSNNRVLSVACSETGSVVFVVVNNTIYRNINFGTGSWQNIGTRIGLDNSNVKGALACSGSGNACIAALNNAIVHWSTSFAFKTSTNVSSWWGNSCAMSKDDANPLCVVSGFRSGSSSDARTLVSLTSYTSSNYSWLVINNNSINLKLATSYKLDPSRFYLVSYSPAPYRCWSQSRSGVFTLSTGNNITSLPYTTRFYTGSAAEPSKNFGIVTYCTSNSVGYYYTWDNGSTWTEVPNLFSNNYNESQRPQVWTYIDSIYVVAIVYMRNFSTNIQSVRKIVFTEP